MKQLLLYIVLCVMIAGGLSCSKGGGSSSEPPEANLSISLNPDPGTSVVSALSATYAFKLLINSTPPKNGVKIDITGTRDSDNIVLITQSSQTSSNSVNNVDMQLNSLVSGVLYTVKVDVTSLTTLSNKATIIFKVARK